MTVPLDLVTIGRCSVDLYGQQIGSRLEDTVTFSKAVGGCPTNIAIGTSRLGLRSAIITRVGDEQMGRFVLEQLAREGVDTSAIVVDPDRLTSLVLLGVRDQSHFPMIFYRDNCADAALDEADIDPAVIARARAILVTGTHFARPNTSAAQRRAIALARGNGARIILDIDYRPNLWGLAGHESGESRYVKSDAVTASLAPILPDCDLIVGTEEELHIAAGCENTLDAIRAIRIAASRATIVCKRGPMGCVVFPGAIPATIDDGTKGPGFPVEVYNTLGAGDAFMSGFLRGWLRDEPLETCCAWANASGALVVSRLLCSSEIPSFVELQHFIAYGSPFRAVRRDAALSHLHRVTTRPPPPPHIMALAIDHRSQLEAAAREAGAPLDRIGAFKTLALDATLRVARGRSGFGMLLDGTYGQDALFRAAGHDLWLARPVERPGSRPLEFETDDLGSHLVDWPSTLIVKCLCFYHPDDPESVRSAQEQSLIRLHDACRTVDRPLLIEIIAGRHGPLHTDTVARVLDRFYTLGVKPDWWKLEAQPSTAAWRAIGDVIRANDPFCNGIVLLGLEAPVATLTAAFRDAESESLVRGFAVGRSIFSEPAADWFAGRITDEGAVAAMAACFTLLVQAWQSAGAGMAA